MKRILYIGNNLTTSNPTTLVQLSALLREANFEVVVYSNKQNKLLRLFDMCFGVFKHRNVDYMLIDTYSTTNFYFALILSQLARILSIKYIPILHGGNLPIRLFKSPKFSRLIFNNSYINVTPSNYLFYEFKQKGFKTTYIPNAIDLNNYKFKERFKIQPKLLWVRAFDKIYNPFMAIDVLTILKVKYPHASLCMVGPDKDGSFRDVQQKAINNGVLNLVEFTGILPKKAWLQKSEILDIFINTTTIDNIPVSVIEAMALGLPVVSTNVGGLPYLITDKLNGILVENKNAVDMADAIEKLLSNFDEVKRVTINARKMVSEFDIALVKQQWINILK